MKPLILLVVLLVALAPALAQAQNETCPRIWRSGDSLLTDPAPHIQWLRDGTPIPDANRSWLLPTQLVYLQAFSKNKGY